MSDPYKLSLEAQASIVWQEWRRLDDIAKQSRHLEDAIACGKAWGRLMRLFENYKVAPSPGSVTGFEENLDAEEGHGFVSIGEAYNKVVNSLHERLGVDDGSEVVDP